MLYVFVTVGSTSFESLIENIDNENVLSKLKSLCTCRTILKVHNCRMGVCIILVDNQQ